ncbi:MAG: hypothetical protein ABGY95_12475 [Rubritalea sp.]|uniref:hypothetical protein n=1 Tax=Rubritalea sp. TaxID=2109375 RepID=UPI003242B7E0
MTVKTFFIGLIASFALPWLAVVAVPYATMRAVEIPQYDLAKDGKEGAYSPVKSGFVEHGSSIYGAEGCAQCHSQLARPTYAGNDLGRPDLAGIAKDPELGDTRRESQLWDYAGEPYAWIGETRMGPDLSNYGRRMDVRAAYENKALADELGIKVDQLTQDQKFDVQKAVYLHLYDPRSENVNSICPSNKCFFETKTVYGQGARNALPGVSEVGKQVIPSSKAETLASYLLGLRRDGAVPNSMDFARNKKSSK